jgi:hypothetical protein
VRVDSVLADIPNEVLEVCFESERNLTGNHFRLAKPDQKQESDPDDSSAGRPRSDA